MPTIKARVRIVTHGGDNRYECDTLQMVAGTLVGLRSDEGVEVFRAKWNDVVGMDVEPADSDVALIGLRLRREDGSSENLPFGAKLSYRGGVFTTSDGELRESATDVGLLSFELLWTRKFRQRRALKRQVPRAAPRPS